jgi:hypothetical protein
MSQLSHGARRDEAPMRVIDDAAECRRIAVDAMDRYRTTLKTGVGFERMSTPQAGDLVLETTTAFRWLGHDRTAPGEALGWLLRVEEDASSSPYHALWWLRPVFWTEGEFAWKNCNFIVVEEGGGDRG